MERLLTIIICAGGLTGLLVALHPQIGDSLESTSAIHLAVGALSVAVALILGELLRLARIGRIVTYALVGALLLPFVASVLPRFELSDALAEYAFAFTFLTATVGLATGLQLPFKSLQSHLRAVIWHTILGGLFAGAAGFICFTYGAALGLPVAGIWTALLAGAVVACAAPDAVMATLGEHAEGHVTHLEVHVAVVRMVFAILAIVVILFIMVAEREQSVLPASRWLAELGYDLAPAIGGGIVAGVLLLGTLRALPNQIIPVALTLCAAAALVIPDGPALAGIAALIAGAMVANFSELGFTLTEALDRTGPLYLSPFFTFLFAGIPLATTVTSWSAIAALLLTLSIVNFLSSQVSAKLLNSAQDVTAVIGTSVLAQGTPALLLVGYLALESSDFGSLRETLSSLILLQLILGTTLHRIVLARRNHVDPADVALANRLFDPGALTTLDMPRRGNFAQTSHQESLLPLPDYEVPKLRSESLNRMLTRLLQRFRRVQDQFAEAYFDPHFASIEATLEDAQTRLREHLLETFEDLKESSDPKVRSDLIRAQRASLSGDLRDLIAVHGADLHGKQLKTELESLLERVQSACIFPAVIRALEEAHHRSASPGDSRRRRLRKLILRIAGKAGPATTRVVPVRLLADYYLVDGLPGALEPTANMIGRSRTFAWRKIFRIFDAIDAMYVDSLSFLEDHEPDTAQGVAHEVEVQELQDFERRLAQGAQPLEVGLSDEVSSPLLESQNDQFDDKLLDWWATRLTDVSEDFTEAMAEISQFDLDARRRLDLCFASIFKDFYAGVRDSGTFLAPARRLHPEQREAQAERDLGRLFDGLVDWRRLSRAYIDRRLMWLHFRRLEFALRSVLAQSVERTFTELYSHLTYYPAEISERCEEVAKELTLVTHADASPSDMADAIAQIRTNITVLIQDEALQDINQMRETNGFSQLTRELSETLVRLVDEGPPVFHVVDDSIWDGHETSGLRGLEPLEIPYNDHLKATFVRNSIRGYSDLDIRVSQVIETLTTGLAEINRIVSFNLDAALAELRDSKDEDEAEDPFTVVAEFAIGGLQRAGEHAGDLLDEIREEIDQVDRLIVDETVTNLRDARVMLFDSSIPEIRAWLLTMRKNREGPRILKQNTLVELRDRGLALVESVRDPVREAFYTAQDQFLAEEDLQTLQADAGLASFEDIRTPDIPTTYRRLFQPSPVDIPDLYIPMIDPLEDFAAAALRWKSGRRVAIAVIGSPGGGKTSFVHRALTESLGDLAMLRWNIRGQLNSEAEVCRQICGLFGLRAESSPERILASLKEVPGARVVLIDGLEHLFLRSMNGHHALETTLRIISQSPQNLLWVATSNHVLWQYLNTMHDLSDFFSDRISLGTMNRAQIEDMVMRRHAVTGYRLEFISNAPSISQEKARDRYFDDLFGLSDGHPVDALYYWMESVRSPGEESLLEIRTPKRLRLGHLRRLDTEKLLGLGQLMMHGSLTEAQFAQVMRVSADEARRDIAYLEGLGLVEANTDREPRCRVNAVLTSEILNALQARNII